MTKFTAQLQPVPRGGMYVVVPDAIAEAAGVAHGSRVCGTINGVAYRSSTPRYAGGMHLGVHKATLAAAGVGAGDRVTVTIAPDTAPLPADEVPADLAAAIAKNKTATARWAESAPSHRREHVMAVLAAKQQATRVRRIAKTVAMLVATPAKKKPAAKKR